MDDQYPQLSSVIEVFGHVGMFKDAWEGCRAAASVPDFLFRKKLKRFLEKLAQLPKSERDDLLAKFMAEDESHRVRAVEILVLSIDQLTQLEKTDLLAAAFRSYAVGDCSNDQFLRLVHAIGAAYTLDLSELLREPEDDGRPSKRWTSHWRARLAYTGLTESGGSLYDFGQTWVISPLGRACRKAFADFQSAIAA